MDDLEATIKRLTDFTEKEISKIENAIANTDEPSPEFSDNLAIMLCSYFSGHMDRPEDDDENDDNHHWGAWVIAREAAMRREITLTAIKAVTKALRSRSLHTSGDGE